MITNQARENLVDVGQRLRGGYLLQQANYTLSLAKDVGLELEATLPQGLIADAQAAVKEVEKGLKDRANLACESKDATRVQNETMRKVREWRRKMSALGRMATRTGAEVPEQLTTIGRTGTSVQGSLKALHEAIGLLKERATMFKPFPLYDAVLGEGENLATTLSAVDADQEKKRLSDLPKAVLDYYAAKGLLYTAVKIINDAGRALFAGDVPMAARFNMGILYRAPGRASTQATPQPAANP